MILSERTHPVSLAYIQSTHLMMLLTDAGFLDLFDFIPGLPKEPVESLFDTAATANGMKFVSLHWLRKMKETAGRPAAAGDRVTSLVPLTCYAWGSARASRK